MRQQFIRSRSLGLACGLTMVGALTVALWASIWQGGAFVHGQTTEKFNPEVVKPDGDNSQQQESVVQEILEIQESLGGSLVDDKFPAEQFSDAKQQSAQQLATNSDSTNVAAPSKPIVALRETAWQLDGAAHRLECLDLYQQADSLRQLARKIRQEARDRREHQVAKSD